METKYRDIIGLNDYFQPAYDLTNEVRDYWKQFIPNSKFFDVLRGVLHSLEGRGEKRSLWIQGTYGTGKSHATAVIKHLLFDASDEIQMIVENFDDPQIKTQLLQLRKNRRVFPVVLKGVSNINDPRTFALAIEKAVKKALQQYNITINTKSDFERLIDTIQKNRLHSDWNLVIQSYPQLKMFVRNKEELIRKLQEENVDILRKVEALSSEIRVHFSHENITDWLCEVMAELRQQGHADALMIYWDEFTTLLELTNSRVLLTELEHIAELSVNQGIYLYVVAHRKPSQAQIAKEDFEKAMGRFKWLDYSMETITTYHIIGASLRKIDRAAYEALRDRALLTMNPLIQRIIGSDGDAKHYHLLKNMFPIHPYTAYLTTFLARTIGSTERSIFNFLYDQEKGFLRFLQEHPTDGHGVFLTADALWDFFAPEFERIDYQRFSTILQRYTLHIQRVEQENSAYCVIFKGVLLLNILQKMESINEISQALVLPNIDNIQSMFWQTDYHDMVEPALTFFDEHQILSKNPDNLFLVAASILPPQKVEDEKKGLLQTYQHIENILYGKHLDDLQATCMASILRETEFKVFDAHYTEAQLKNKLPKPSYVPHKLHVVAIIARDIQEREQSKLTVQRILQDPSFEHIIFIVFEEILEQRTFTQFLDYRAHADIYARLTLKDEQKLNNDYAQKTLQQWVQTLKTGYIEWFVAPHHEPSADSSRLFGKCNGKILIHDFRDRVNDELVLNIFRFGLENLNEVKKNQNVWRPQVAKASAEHFLFASNREELEQKTSSGPSLYLRGLLKNNAKEYIVDEQLQFKENPDPFHPLVKMSASIEQAIMHKKQGTVFNLGEVLRFLTESPFGVYANMAHLATVGFLMRPYVGKLYEAGKGKPIEKEMMRDRIEDLFNFWKTGKGGNKLEVRLGTHEEKEVVQKLAHIFGLANIESLSDVRWRIRDWIKDAQYPLWVFTRSAYATPPIITAITNIIELIESAENEISYNSIKSLLESVKAVETDLRMFIFKQHEAHDLFLGWLRTIEHVEIPDEKIQEVIAYIRQNMPEEVGVASWKEGNVREKVKDWYIKQTKTQTPEPIPNVPVSSPSTVLSPNPAPPVTQVKETSSCEAMFAKIDAYQGDWRAMLKKIVFEHQELIGIFERYLNN